MTDLINKSIIVCSIVRNAEKGLRRNVPVVKALCRRFGDYRVVVYENDSTDGTKEVLREWMAEDGEHVFALLHDTDATKTIPAASAVTVNPFFSRKRIAKMADLRNQYLAFVEKEGWTADYLMVVDLDVAQLDLEGILSSFAEDAPGWDAVTAYGYSTSPSLQRRYHDTYALVKKGEAVVPQTEKSIHDNALAFAAALEKGEWVRVDSAFGGLSIYRFECVRGLRYQVTDNEDERVEVRCEHQSIYAQMRSRGFDRIYVNPKMKLKYQDLTMEIVMNSMKRKLRKIFGGGDFEEVTIISAGTSDLIYGGRAA